MERNITLSALKLLVVLIVFINFLIPHSVFSQEIEEDHYEKRALENQNLIEQAERDKQWKLYDDQTQRENDFIFRSIWGQLKNQAQADVEREKKLKELKDKAREDYKKFRYNDKLKSDFIRNNILREQLENAEKDQDLKYWIAYYTLTSGCFDDDSKEEAFSTIQKLAEAGHSGAMNISGYFLMTSLGEATTRAEQKEMETKANLYFKKSIENGNRMAYYYERLSNRICYETESLPESTETNQGFQASVFDAFSSAVLGQVEQLKKPSFWESVKEPSMLFNSMAESTFFFDNDRGQTAIPYLEEIENSINKRNSWRGKFRFDNTNGEWSDALEVIDGVVEENRSIDVVSKLKNYSSNPENDIQSRVVSLLIKDNYLYRLNSAYRNPEYANFIDLLNKKISNYAPLSNEEITKMAKAIAKMYKQKRFGYQILDVQSPLYVYKKLLADLLSSSINPNPNFEEAYNLYKEVANEGSPSALYKLGRWHVNGFHVKKDYQLARDYFSKSKRYDAHYELARLFDFGLGGEKNPQLAAKNYLDFFVKRAKIRYYYKNTIDYKMINTIDGLKRNDKNLLKDFPVFGVPMSESSIKELISISDNKIKVVHFSKPKYEADRKSNDFDKFLHSLSLTNWCNNNNVSYYLGSLGDADPTLAGFMRYKGLFIKYQERGNGDFYDYDKRWKRNELPATFVYVEGSEEPFYFGKDAKAAQIVEFIKTQQVKLNKN